MTLLLAENNKPGFMTAECEQYQIGIIAINAVRGVGIVVVAGAALLLSDKIHDFVLALPWHGRVREDYSQGLIHRVRVQLQLLEELQVLG